MIPLALKNTKPSLAGIRPRLAPVVGASLLALCAIYSPAMTQTAAGTPDKDAANHILRPSKAPVALTPDQQVFVDKLTKSPETVSVGVLNVPDAAGAEQTAVTKIVLPLGGGKEMSLVRTRPTVKSERGFIWRGEVEETGERAVLMLSNDGHLSGFFSYKGRVFMLNHMGGDIHTMAEINPRKLPPDHPPGAPGAPISNEAATHRVAPPEPTVSQFTAAERLALEAKKITIDLMVLYTKNASSSHLGNPADVLALAVEDANESFSNSGLGNIIVRLVHTQAIDYDEAGADQFDHLYRMVDGFGPFAALKNLRNEKRADIVGLVLESSSGCGLSTRVGADAEEAFFVVHHACAGIALSLAHEIGHILGARHDRFVDANDKPFAYAHGYVNGTNWRTMMGYNEACGGCPRIPFWSNPRIMYKGEPTGTAAADNARVILEQAERVSKNR